MLATFKSLKFNLILEAGRQPPPPSSMWASEACLCLFLGFDAAGYPACTSQICICVVMTLHSVVCSLLVAIAMAEVPAPTVIATCQLRQMQSGKPLASTVPASHTQCPHTIVPRIVLH